MWRYLELQELLASGLQLGHGNMPSLTSGALIILHGLSPTLCTLGNALVVLCCRVLLFVLYSMVVDSLSGASFHSSESAVVALLPTSSPHQYLERSGTTFSQKPQEKSHHDSLALTESQAQL